MITANVLFSKSAIATQILLESENCSLLVDVGDGTLRDLTSQRFDFGKLKAILITHEHADHTGGLFALLHFMKHLPRSEPLYLYVPKPIVYLDKLLQEPLMYSKAQFPIQIVEVEDSSVKNLGPFAIEPFLTTHVDFDSMGYSIKDQSGYRVVVSGDTTATEELRTNVRDADLAVLEATFEDKYAAYAERYGHMTVSQAKEIGRLAKKMMLVHEMPMEYFLRMTCAEIPPMESRSQ